MPSSEVPARKMTDSVSRVSEEREGRKEGGINGGREREETGREGQMDRWVDRQVKQQPRYHILWPLHMLPGTLSHTYTQLKIFLLVVYTANINFPCLWIKKWYLILDV